jgi:hypothetical protein
MIGSLIYVTTSRPDIMKAIGLVARFQAAPKETNVQAVKMIFKYIKGTLDFDLWNPRGEYFTLKNICKCILGRSVDERKVQVEEHYFWVTT